MRSLGDVMILPPYAKFIFSLSENFKQKILDFISAYLNQLELDWDKLHSFLRAFYTNNDANFNQLTQSKNF